MIELLKQKVPTSNIKMIRVLLPYIWEGGRFIKLRIIFGLILVIATIVINVITPMLLKYTVQALHEFELSQNQQIYYWALWLLLIYGCVYTIAQIIQKARQLIFYKVIENGIREFSLKLFTHLHDLDLKFHLNRKIGAITSSVEKFHYVLPEIFWTLTLFIIPTIIEVCISICILFYFYHWIYPLTLLCILLIFSILSFVGIARIKVAQLKYEDQMQHVHSQMVDSLLNFETVRYFNNKEYEATLFNNSLKTLEKKSIDFRIKSDLTQMSLGISFGLGLWLLTWISGREVLNGELHSSDFIAINCYLLQFIAPMVNFGWMIVQVKQGFLKLRYIMELLEEKSTIVDAPNAKKLNANPANIIFEEVNFHYHPERAILKNISFEVPAGNVLAIVGSSGAGKSTIARLLFRFYDVVHGKILINDQEIRDVTQESLHATIGVVSQDTVLFNTTLYNNIRYGNPNASKQEIEKVVHLVHLNKFISLLPDGFNTLVGERGLKLSGGEKQRIAIARALLKKPSIYLFDEATSSLDTVTEQEIKRNIMEVSKGITTIIIAHRLSAVTHADNIIVLDKGVVAEQGKHSELIKKDAIYAKLWKKHIEASSIQTP